MEPPILRYQAALGEREIRWTRNAQTVQVEMRPFSGRSLAGPAVALAFSLGPMLLAAAALVWDALYGSGWTRGELASAVTFTVLGGLMMGVLAWRVYQGGRRPRTVVATIDGVWATNILGPGSSQHWALAKVGDVTVGRVVRFWPMKSTSGLRLHLRRAGSILLLQGEHAALEPIAQAMREVLGLEPAPPPGDPPQAEQ